AMFDSLEFRTLRARAENFFGIESRSEEVISSDDPSIAKEVQVMFWLLDSNKTDPSPIDIMRDTGASTLEGAHETLKEKIGMNELSQVWTGIAQPLVPGVDEMNSRGMGVDTAYLQTVSRDYGAKLKEIEARILSIAGME